MLIVQTGVSVGILDTLKNISHPPESGQEKVTISGWKDIPDSMKLTVTSREFPSDNLGSRCGVKWRFFCSQNYSFVVTLLNARREEEKETLHECFLSQDGSWQFACKANLSKSLPLHPRKPQDRRHHVGKVVKRRRGRRRAGRREIQWHYVYQQVTWPGWDGNGIAGTNDDDGTADDPGEERGCLCRLPAGAFLSVDVIKKKKEEDGVSEVD